MRWPQNNSIASTKHPFHTLATGAETHVLFIRRGFQQPVDSASKPNYNRSPPPSQHHPLGGIHFIDPANRENKDREEIKVINWAYVNAASLGWKLKSGAIRCSQRVMRPCAQISHRYAQLHIPLCSLFLSQYWSNLWGYYTAFSQKSIIIVHTDNDAAWWAHVMSPNFKIGLRTLFLNLDVIVSYFNSLNLL